MRTDILDIFFEYMKLSKSDIHDGDLVDDVDDNVMYMYQVIQAMASYICLICITKCYSSCGVYMIINNIRYYMAIKGGTKEFGGTIHIIDGIS